VTMKRYQDGIETESETMNIGIKAHQVLKADVSVSASAADEAAVINFGIIEETLSYDFDGDGDIDDSDIVRISSRWNACVDSENWDPFYDLDDDGCITVLDIMSVVNSKTVH